MKKERAVASSKGKKFNLFKLAWLSGLLLVLFMILMSLVSSIFGGNMNLQSGLSMAENIILNLLEIFFIIGFYYLGKKYNSTLLKVISILIIIFIILCFLSTITVLSPIILNMTNIVISTASDLGINPAIATTEQQQLIGATLLENTTFVSLLFAIISLFIIYVVLFGILSILLGVGLLRVRKNVRYAKTAGILEIVGGATSIILIGFLVIAVAFIFEFIIFRNESKN